MTTATAPPWESYLSGGDPLITWIERKCNRGLSRKVKVCAVSETHIHCVQCKGLVPTQGKLQGNLRCPSCHTLLDVTFDVRAFVVVSQADEAA